MSRITDNEAIQAAKALEAYCISNHECDGCIFYDRGECGVWDPCDWKIPDPVPEEPRDSKRLRGRAGAA